MCSGGRKANQLIERATTRIAEGNLDNAYNLLQLAKQVMGNASNMVTNGKSVGQRYSEAVTAFYVTRRAQFPDWTPAKSPAL